MASRGSNSFINLWARAKFPVLIFCLSISLHLLHLGLADWGAAFLSPHPTSDAYYYHYQAWFTAFIDSSGGYSAEFMSPSIYVELLTWIYRLFGFYSIVPFALNAVLMSLAAVFIGLTARLIFDSRTGWLAGLMASLFGPFIFFASLSIKTNIVIMLLSAACYLAVLFFQQRRMRSAIATVLMLGLAGLERHNLLLVLLLFIGMASWHVWQQQTKKQLLILVSGFLVVFVILLGVSSWDITSGEEPKVSSPIGLNFYVGNAPGSWGGYTHVKGIRNDLMGHRTLSSLLAKKLGKPDMTRGEISRYWFNQSWSYYKDHPGEYAVLQLRKLGLIFAQGAQGVPEEYPAWRWHRPALTLAIFDSGIVIVLAGFGLYFLRGRYREPAIQFLFYSAVLYAFSMWLFFITERYRLSLMVLILPFAAYGIKVLWDSAGVNILTKRLILLVILYIGTLGLNLLIPHAPGWGQYNAEVREVETRWLKQENRTYQLMHQVLYAPSPEAWVRLSQMIEQKGFLLDAKIYARRAIDMAPERILGYERLVQVVLQQSSEAESRQLEHTLMNVSVASRREQMILKRLRQLIARHNASFH